LTAILQSADEVTQLIKTLTLSSSTDVSQSLIHDIDQAASTIFACGEHQKKIIDDILNVSKMDAGLLTVEPVPVQPHAALHKVMKMFGPEFKAKGITSSFNVSACSVLSVELGLMDLYSVAKGRILKVLRRALVVSRPCAAHSNYSMLPPTQLKQSTLIDSFHR
jgi:signal transduction histidine kinase